MKRFILSLLLAFCFFYGLSQSENVALQEVLMKSVWTGCNEKGDIDQGVVKIRCSFSTDTLTVLFKEKGEKYEIKSPYYISETAEVVFNEDNVGKYSDGEYLIIKTGDTFPCVLKVYSYSDSLIEYEEHFKSKRLNIEYIRQGAFVSVE